jgi:putative membrane-bound dehydrogenase-like protein
MKLLNHVHPSYRCFLSGFAAIALSFASLLAAPPPKAPDVPAELPPHIELLQPGVKLTLLAEHPALVTPTGIDVDAQGRIWTVSCHTHFRPQGYAGPEHDEVLVFDRDGKNRRVFYNRTTATMNLKVGRDGWIYLAERSRILRVKDSDGDGQADVAENIATLDTIADYPHNGLAGMAWLPDGDLLFSHGENFGKDWTLTGRDGAKLTGRGEGGIFRCRPNGSGLRRIARGFWNPFGLLARKDGELFAVDNDPGSRPPCRLLNVVEGADYGFQWVYGSAPVHPFVAWNGELRGTLGMVHPSGEGPCSIVELGGGVLVPSWSNHRLDYFPLTRKGAGYTASRVELLRGGDFFRPSCLATGPDGAFYFNDWVFSAYTLHGKGRLWKLEVDKAKATWLKPAVEPPDGTAQLAKNLREGKSKPSERQLFDLVRGNDAYLADAALTALARLGAQWTPEHVRGLAAKDRVWALVALRRVNLNEEKWVRLLLNDADPEIRFECLRWIADAVLTGFSSDVERMLTRPDLDYRLFEAALAAWNTLRGKPEAGVTDATVLVDRVTSAATPARLKGYALRLAPATHAKLTVPLLRELLAANDPVLSLEVVRTLAARDAEDARAVLAEIAADEKRPIELRADATAGLASALTPVHQPLLLKLAPHANTAIRNEALRALRAQTLDAAARQSLGVVAQRHAESAPLVKAALEPASIEAGRPPVENTAAWLKRLAALPGKPDVEAGRRIFFHSRVAMCSTCHRHSGRGNVVGPDLSLVAQQGDQRAILQSLLEPNREVAPQFFPTQLELKDGTEFTGILLRSSSVDVFRDLTGKERSFKPTDIVKRAELKTSLMPAGLVASVTDTELRDLLAFLTSRATPESARAAIQASPRAKE